MKKLSLAWKKYINRVSVLVTVFSVLVTASFYNPASLASTREQFIWRVVSPALNGDWVVWNPVDDDFSTYVDGGSSRGVFVSSGSYYSTYYGSSSTGNSGKDYHSSGSVSNYVMNSYRFTLPFFLLPLLDREPGSVFTVDGKFNLTILLRLDSDLSGNDIYCSPASLDGLLPDGMRISFFQTSGAFTLSHDRTSTVLLGVQLVFDNVELGADRDHLSFNVIFDGACFGGGPVGVVNIAPDVAYSFCVYDASLSVRAGYAHGSDRDIVDGYDSSQGNASQSKLDNSLSGQEAKEDSLFTSASANLSKFSLTDLSALPNVVAGLSFVSSTMTSIFEALGGVNGAGIVLSVGCSILFVSFCIGAYKFYSGRKD